jgi:S-adenosylmethionine hydrolase
MQRPIITLISDFGLADEYVGVLKGVILSRNSNIQTVDICHTVPPQDIAAAARLLERSFRYFPPATVHLVIVDPGVGSSRSILAIDDGNQYFVGPDNGVFTPVLEQCTSLTVYRVTRPEHFLQPLSNTFHGRDIMAPVAAHLASGLAIDRLGPEMDSMECTRIARLSPVHIGGTVRGVVAHIDRFGNLATNIGKSDIAQLKVGDRVCLRIGDTLIAHLSNSYADGDEGAILALFDSQGYLEIGVNMGNAAQTLDVAIGAAVTVRGAEA